MKKSRRTFIIRRDQVGWPLTRFLPQVLGERWRLMRVSVNGRPCRDLRLRLRLGDSVQTEPAAAGPAAPKKAPPQRERKPGKADQAATELQRAIRVVFWDEHIVVVDKPAGLTTVRHRDEVEEMGAKAGRFLPPTLVDLLPRVLPPAARKGRLRAVHRLDRDTTGLVVVARTLAAESNLGLQFRAHTIERRYLALLRGQAQDERIETWLVRDRGDGRRGSGPKQGGQKAVTNIRVVELLGDFTLVECTLETGRTHQVRIHLGERGTPLCGERIYDRPLHGAPLADPSGAGRPLLHAAALSIDHPATGERLTWTSKLPPDMQGILKAAKPGGK